MLIDEIQFLEFHHEVNGYSRVDSDEVESIVDTPNGIVIITERDGRVWAVSWACVRTWS